MPTIDASALVGEFYDPPYPPVNPAMRQAEDETVEWLRRIGFITSQARRTTSARSSSASITASPHLGPTTQASCWA